MPTYTYFCDGCQTKFELFSTISNYDATPSCVSCKRKTQRYYYDDLANLSCSIKKHDSELKTVGDLANRNRDTMSDDHKHELYQKHNSYKHETKTDKPLPKGMNRIKKTKKTKWT